MRSSVIIVNEKANWGGLPNAISRVWGPGSGQHKVRQAAALLDGQGLSFSTCATQYPGHACELAAAAAAQGTDTVIVIGGDGTVNEVVNGLLTAGRDPLPRVGIIPAGSSNDFSKSLGIPQRLREACRVIARGKVREVDVGRAGSRYFCSASCLGYFAEVAARTVGANDYSPLGRRGSLRYVIPALGVIRKMAGGWEMTVKADERVFHGDYAVLLVGNAPRFGGLTMLPGAGIDDGVLDCLLVEMASRWEALRLIPLVYRKALERHPKVTRFRTTSLAVTLHRPSQVCDDGEMDASPVRSIDYGVLPRRLQVLC
jgi:YegS/Rv2252/BmrU family lipid kinase